MSKIKVLMVLGNTGRGGAQTFAVNVLRLIDRNKFQIDFAVNEIYENGYTDEIISYGSQIYVIPYFKIHNWLQYEKSWNKLLNQEHYDIIHGHVSSSASIYLDIARKHNCTTIAHSHSAGYRGGTATQFVKKLFTLNAKNKAYYWFACSSSAAERMFGKNYREYNHYYDMPNAIVVENYLFNSKKRLQIRESLGLKDNNILYGHVGSFSEAKNHDFLIRIFEAIHKLQPNARFILAGDGILRTKIETEIKECGLEKYISLVGNVGNVNEYFMAMDAMVFPSLFEGFPVSLLEAQATGLKTIASDTITDEVFLTGCIKKFSLKQSALDWAKEAIVDMSIDRCEQNKIISNSKYNMQNSVRTIMKLYQEMYEEKNNAKISD